METALQVDLSKPEAPAEQVLDTVSISSKPPVNKDKSIEVTASRDDQVGVSDGFETAAQVRLHPKGSTRHKAGKTLEPRRRRRLRAL